MGLDLRRESRISPTLEWSPFSRGSAVGYLALGSGEWQARG